MKRTAPGRGSGTGWLYVYHCCVSRLTSRYRPLNASSTWSMVNAHTAELPEAPLYLHTPAKHVYGLFTICSHNDSLLISQTAALHTICTQDAESGFLFNLRHNRCVGEHEREAILSFRSLTVSLAWPVYFAHISTRVNAFDQYPQVRRSAQKKEKRRACFVLYQLLQNGKTFRNTDNKMHNCAIYTLPLGGEDSIEHSTFPRLFTGGQYKHVLDDVEWKSIIGQ